MADPTLTNSGTGSATTSSVVASFGFTATAGRLLVLVVISDNYKSGDPSGWTQPSGCGINATSFHGSNMWFKVAAGGETSVTYTIGSAVASLWNVVEYDNIDPTPLDVSNGQFQNSSVDSYTTPAVTPTTGRRLAVGTYGASFGAASTPTGVGTWLNSYTEVKDSVYGVNPTFWNGIATLVLDGDGVTTTSTGATMTGSQGPQSRSGLIAVFKVATGSVFVPRRTLMGVG